MNSRNEPTRTSASTSISLSLTEYSSSRLRREEIVSKSISFSVERHVEIVSNLAQVQTLSTWSIVNSKTNRSYPASITTSMDESRRKLNNSYGANANRINFVKKVKFSPTQSKYLQVHRKSPNSSNYTIKKTEPSRSCHKSREKIKSERIQSSPTKASNFDLISNSKSTSRNMHVDSPPERQLKITQFFQPNTIAKDIEPCDVEKMEENSEQTIKSTKKLPTENFDQCSDVKSKYFSTVKETKIPVENKQTNSNIIPSPFAKPSTLQTKISTGKVNSKNCSIQNEIFSPTNSDKMSQRHEVDKNKPEYSSTEQVGRGVKSKYFSSIKANQINNEIEPTDNSKIDSFPFVKPKVPSKKVNFQNISKPKEMFPTCDGVRTKARSEFVMPNKRPRINPLIKFESKSSVRPSAKAILGRFHMSPIRPTKPKVKHFTFTSPVTNSLDQLFQQKLWDVNSNKVRLIRKSEDLFYN